MYKKSRLSIWWPHWQEEMDLIIWAKHGDCDPIASCKLCTQAYLCIPRHEICIYKHMWE